MVLDEAGFQARSQGPFLRAVCPLNLVVLFDGWPVRNAKLEVRPFRDDAANPAVDLEDFSPGYPRRGGDVEVRLSGPFPVAEGMRQAVERRPRQLGRSEDQAQGERGDDCQPHRSEEHTSELQSLAY